jgi:hypothetical protein
MVLNWNNIRPIHNSLNDGFEELVCQLASKEIIKGQKYFQRIGKPDGGKECYWELGNGNLHIWQAKYFLTSLDISQWTQIEKSVKTAIDNHTKLVKYYICMPLDMPDGKVRKRISMLEKWKAKVSEWKQYASSNGINITFEYWGSTELIFRLSKRENEGLTYFWFNKEEFSDEWLSAKNKESINALGTRYTRELNFELPIAKVFDGLSRDQLFEKQIHLYYKKLMEKYRSIRINIDHEETQKCLISLQDAIKQIRQLYEPFAFIGNSAIPYKELLTLLDACENIATKIEDHLYKLRSNGEKEKGVRESYSRPYANEFSDIGNFKSSIYQLKKFVGSPTCILANRPYLLLVGPAGMGKSHLLADIVEKRKEHNQNSLLLLGENFTNADMPWTQILMNQLRKNQIDEFVFLGALNAKAESEQKRIIVFIDAINEGNGRKIWPKQIKSFIQSFENYRWLGLVISLRTSFEKLIAPAKEINIDLIIRITHNGFAGFEYAAVKRFFTHYRIVQPTAPLLNPDFQNPLFLKLFCKSIFDRELHHVPPGLDGITGIIDYFLESVNVKLARPEELDYDEKRPLVKTVTQKLIRKIVEEGNEYIRYENADQIVDSVFKGACSNVEPYLNRLISEGILNTDLAWSKKGNSFDVVYFAYQRFQDHLTVSLLLDEHFDKLCPEQSFQEKKLQDLIKDQRAIYRNQNIIEALSIQMPERFGKELIEVIPYIKTYPAVAEAFIQSLAWRRNETIGEEGRKYVNEIIIHDSDLYDQFREMIILTSMKPQFYFNAESLHNFLMPLSLAERDEDWTIWLQDKYERDENNEPRAVQRLIDYAWNIEDDQQFIQDECILLGCTTLGWFLTSANRYLRDAATKALVCLLQHRIHLIPKLLKKFKDVNDPYVTERLYAAAYGAVMRTCQKDKLVSVTEYVYEEVFDQKFVYPHILLRDYARGIIEYTLALNYKPSINIIRVRPPYKSEKLPKKFPTVKQIDKKYDPKGESGNYGQENWGATAILMSMTTEYGRGTAGYGDFGRYTFEAAFEDWTVDANRLSNYAVQRIFDLGYQPEIFTEFDLKQGSGRGNGNKERIGKKYQWIIFYELLAQVSDQCPLLDESSWEKPAKTIPYEGPWYPYVRDFDPTTLIKETKLERYTDKYTHHWWYNAQYNFGNKNAADWVVDRNSLPLPSDILEVLDKEGNSWIWLELHPEWTEKEVFVESKWNPPEKRLWYQLRSYLIKKKDFQKLARAFKRDFHRGELPEARSLYTIFDREYYWSPAFKFFDKPYYHGRNWIEVRGNKTDTLLGEVHRTTEWYNWEEEFDSSKTSAIQYYKPTRIIKENLGLQFSDKEGELINHNGELICFDPSVHNKSISGLLIQKEKMMNFLKKEDLILVWSVVGEKQLLGDFKHGKGVKSRLKISGMYTLCPDGIKGKLSFEEE